MNQALAQAYEPNNMESQHNLKGSKVNVDFISDSRTEFSGKHINGIGTVDRHEDGYVYGRLEQGTPFMCPESYVQLNQCDYSRHEFEQWLKTQKQYLTLVFQYGSDVLIYDAIDGYKILAVALAFEVWKQLVLCREKIYALESAAFIATSTQRGGDHGQ